jgi:hypothetical protein
MDYGTRSKNAITASTTTATPVHISCCVALLPAPPF